MSWVMVGITATSAGLQIGGGLGGNKDAQTAGGLLGLAGAGYGGMGGAGASGVGGLSEASSLTGGSLAPYDAMGAASGIGDMVGGSGVPWKKLMTVGALQGMGNMMGGQEQGPPQMVPGTSPQPPSPNPFASLVQPYQYYG